MKYRTLLEGFWKDPELRSLGHYGLVTAQHLLLSSHTNLVGCFRCPPVYTADDTISPIEEVQKALEGLQEVEWLRYCPDSGWVLVTNFLRFNPIPNPNVAKAAKSLIEAVPRSIWFYSHFVDCLEICKNRFEEGYLDRLRNRSPNGYRNGFGNGYPNGSDRVSGTHTDTPPQTPSGDVPNPPCPRDEETLQPTEKQQTSNGSRNGSPNGMPNQEQEQEQDIDSESSTESESDSGTGEREGDRGVGKEGGKPPVRAEARPPPARSRSSPRKSRGGRSPPKTTIPDDFELTEDLRADADELLSGVDATAEFALFVDDAKAHGRRYADWRSAWVKWIRNDKPKAMLPDDPIVPVGPAIDCREFEQKAIYLCERQIAGKAATPRINQREEVQLKTQARKIWGGENIAFGLQRIEVWSADELRSRVANLGPPVAVDGKHQAAG